MITPILAGTLPDGEGDDNKVATYNEYVTDVLEPAIQALQTLSAARVYHNADQSIADATSTALAFNSERRDVSAMHDTASNNSRITVPATGWYLLSACVEFEVNATGQRQASFKVNGSTFVTVKTTNAVGGGSLPTRLTPSTVYYLAAGDYVEVIVYQNSGGSLNVKSVGNYSPEFAVIYLGG